jgi:hypothetical protein
MCRSRIQRARMDRCGAPSPNRSRGRSTSDASRPGCACQRRERLPDSSACRGTPSPSHTTNSRVSGISAREWAMDRTSHPPPVACGRPSSNARGTSASTRKATSSCSFAHATTPRNRSHENTYTRTPRNKEPTNQRTNEPTNLRTYEPSNLRTFEPTNPRTYEPVFVFLFARRGTINRPTNTCTVSFRWLRVSLRMVTTPRSDRDCDGLMAITSL